MIENQKLTVAKEGLPVRLDTFISRHYPEVSRSLIVRAIESAAILLNDVPSLKGKKLKAGDRVAIKRLLEQTDVRVLPNGNIPIEIIHEDNDIIVINKPAGIPVHPIDPGETETLANGLVALRPDLAMVIDENPLFPGFVHRLDTDTSGVIVAAKNIEAYKHLREQFQTKKVKKVYVALVHGDVKSGGTIDNYLTHDPKDSRKMKVCNSREGNDKSLRAITHYRVLKHYGETTLLEVKIETGVMHQIRCHLASVGHPVVGDKIYGGKGKGIKDKQKRTRHLLHAKQIGFVHPGTKKLVGYESTVPDVFIFCLTK